MTDRELLEKAAKAAGYARMIYRDETPYVSPNMNGDDFIAWNPLTDDGDALRLAVKLRLDIVHLLPSGVNANVGVARSGYVSDHDCGGDHAAATRRAIVRAAAAIGDAS